MIYHKILSGHIEVQIPQLQHYCFVKDPHHCKSERVQLNFIFELKELSHFLLVLTY